MADLFVSVAKSFRSARSVADGFQFFSVLLLSLSITPACFSNVRTAAVMAQNLVDTLSGQLYIYPWDRLEDSLMSCTVLRLCLFRILERSFQ